jgi:hypothetical protein
LRHHLPELSVLNLGSGSDYRLRAMTREPLFLVANDANMYHPT